MSPRFSDLTIAERLDRKSKIDPATGCKEWLSTKSRGYGVLRIGGRKGKTFLAHRLSFEEANGPIPDGMVVCHHCDNPGCIRTDHLFLGLPKDNMADKVSKGRQARLRGVESGRAKLNEEEVRSIRVIDGSSLREIGRRYGISHVQVLRIRSGEAWPNLTETEV